MTIFYHNPNPAEYWDARIGKITQVNKIRSTFCPETKPLVYIQFWVAESESGIRFFPSRQNFAVLPISWLPGLKIIFEFFEKTMGDIENLT